MPKVAVNGLAHIGRAALKIPWELEGVADPTHQMVREALSVLGVSHAL